MGVGVAGTGDGVAAMRVVLQQLIAATGDGVAATRVVLQQREMVLQQRE